MIHASKQAYIAVGSHRDANGRFEAGDVVIVDDKDLAELLFREGSLDPSAVVDASMFTSQPAEQTLLTELPQASESMSPAAASDRMVRSPGGRRGGLRRGKAAAETVDTVGPLAVDEENDGLDAGQVVEPARQLE